MTLSTSGTVRASIRQTRDAQENHVHRHQPKKTTDMLATFGSHHLSFKGSCQFSQYMGGELLGALKAARWIYTFDIEC
jgi:hypothetical protein